MTTINNTEAGATGRYIDFGASPANNVNVGAQTIIAYCKPTASGGSGFAYMLGKTTAGSTAGLRFFINHNSNAPFLTLGVDSSGSAGNPQKFGTASEVTYNSWQHYEVTWDGSLNHSGVHLYIDGTESTYGFAGGANGVTAINSDSAKNLFLMNRGNSGNLAREFVGSVAYIARWNRVLDSTERTSVRDNGPLSVTSGLILCWVNQADLGPNALSPAGRSTHVDGDTPPNTALGDSDTSLAGAATATASATGTLVTDIPLAGAAAATAAATGTLAGGAAALAGAAQAQAAAAAALAMTIRADYERSSVELSESSVSGVGDSALITLKPRLQASEVTSGEARWLEPSARVDGVNGFRPTFRFSSYLTSGTGMYHGQPWQSTRRPMFAYDLDYPIAWTYFDTAVTVSPGSHVEFRHSTAFTQDTVYIARSRQVPVTAVGQWCEAMASAYPGVFVPSPTAAAFTPTLTTWPGQSFIADEFSAQTNELSETIPATPMYGAMINNTSLTPAGGVAKRVAQISSGLHAGEDLGTVNMFAFVDAWLGASAWAIAMQTNYILLISPCESAPPRAGGGWRGSFTLGTGGIDDPNRHASDTTPGLEVVTKPRTARATDRGALIPDFFIDFHSSYSGKFAIFSDPGKPLHATFTTRLASYSGQTITDEGDTAAGFLSRYYQDTVGSQFSITFEFGDPSMVTDADIDTVADAAVRTLDSMFVQLVAAATAAASASATLAGAGAVLAGSAQDTAYAVANLTTAIQLGGASLSVASASGTLIAGVPLDGAAIAVSAAAGALTAQIRLNGAALAQAAASAGLFDAAALQGDAQAVAAASAVLTVEIRLVGAATGSAGGDAYLTTAIPLSGAAIAQAIAEGALVQDIPLFGVAFATAGAAGALASGAGAPLRMTTQVGLATTFTTTVGHA